MPDSDRTAALVSQWQAERPDLDLETMGLVARLLTVARLIEARIGALAAEHGLTVGEGDLLFTLRRAGAPFRLSPTRLAEALLVSSGTVTNRLDNLERRGLIERSPNPDDRRAVDIVLTPAGLELVEAAVGEHVAREAEMVAPLGAGDRRALARALGKLEKHLRGS